MLIVVLCRGVLPSHAAWSNWFAAPLPVEVYNFCYVFIVGLGSRISAQSQCSFLATAAVACLNSHWALARSAAKCNCSPRCQIFKR